MIKEVLQYRVSIQQLVYLAVLFAVPYGIVGFLWAANHSAHLDDASGLDRLLSLAGEVLAWPVLIVADITLR